jgi:hypothetical protein
MALIISGKIAIRSLTSGKIFSGLQAYLCNLSKRFFAVAFLIAYLTTWFRLYLRCCPELVKGGLRHFSDGS